MHEREPVGQELLADIQLSAADYILLDVPAGFIPGGSEEQLRWFNDLCQRTITAETAARIMESRMHIDVVALLPRVAMPTLVLHARGDEAAKDKGLVL